MISIQNNDIKDQLLYIELIQNKRILKYKPINTNIPIKLSLKNNDTSLTEKIIKYNIDFKNLKYKIIITKLDNIDNVIKSKYLHKHYPYPIDEIKYIDYTPKDICIDIDSLISDYLYKIQVLLIEKILYTNTENKILLSNIITLNPYYGIITQKVINTLYKDKYKINEYFSKSEKDNIKAINNEINLKNLNNVITYKDIKNLTYEGRTYENLTQFVNSKNKSSKLMTKQRKQKIIYSAESDNYFSTKMNIHNQTKNLFGKNEWFMGPVYSYDYNYNQYS